MASVPDDDGVIDPAEVLWYRAAAAHHQPEPGLVCVENTHTASGGRPWALAALEAVIGAAGPVPVHMDGARIFNAEVATGVPAARYCQSVTTVMACLSKGLSAPVGSCLAGGAGAMAEARVERKRLGGAMRQAGVIAAAGLVALRSMVDRLAEDHHRARRLADAVATRWPELGSRLEDVPTNIVVFPHRHADALLDYLATEGVLAGTIAPGVVRLMTHNDVDDDGADHAAKVIAAAPMPWVAP
jgi:threonine aldolase